MKQIGRMNGLVYRWVVLFLLVCLWTAACADTRRPPAPVPFKERGLKIESAVEPKARELFKLAREENRNLQWNECLAKKAWQRARWMADSGTFAHRDPRTGKNPAWDMVKDCLGCSYMGENLTRGDEPASALHDTLMRSPSHRGNIRDRHYRYLGVGCYGQICVQLFAG